MKQKKVSHLLLDEINVVFLGGMVVKNPSTNADARDVSLIHGSGKSLEVGNGNLFQNTCLGKPVDRGAWWATVHGVTKSQTQLSTRTKRMLDWLLMERK